MPWYDLECGACGATSELEQRMNARQPTRCAKCGKRQVRRVILKPIAVRSNYAPARKNRGRGY